MTWISGKMVRHSALLLAVVLALLLGSDIGRAGDRDEFSKVLQTIPPNGPFWQYGNVVMRRKSKKAGMPPVVFAHWSHRAKYTCRVCHLELGFSMHSGDTGITRSQYLAGRYCGACHDGKTAFSAQGDRESPVCGKCHMKDTRDLEKRFEKFAEALPLASFGNGIDWMAAQRDRKVSPRNSLLNPRFVMQFPEKLRVPITLGAPSSRSAVTFSHEDHFTELDCSICHPDIFNIKKKGTVAFSMERNIYGDFCGACHRQVAFPMNDCRRCHPGMANY
jgi:c(7)-type cytochrome triheme protein